MVDLPIQDGDVPFLCFFTRRFSSFSSGSNGDDILDMRIFIVGIKSFVVLEMVDSHHFLVV